MNTYRHLFPELEEALVEELLEKGRIVHIEAGATLLKAGQNIRNTIIVLEGLVKLYRENDEGSEFFMYHLHPGDTCALSLVCDRTFRASAVTARAVSNATLLVVPIEQTEHWMRQYRTWYHFVVGTYRKRYEELLETIDHIAFRNMDERLEFYLRRHRDSLKSNILHITNTEIAQELNSSREVISRLMKKLSEAGKVRLLKSGIEILRL
ncbi:MAG TPA: Crp/Fnr family transcriptional regulator [Saprospiraceae bacterium]|nr:Crp/Fnr family transcriptional regulator [Saprospiraceae bacterium]HNM24095.1 Crp/Fnr family transcriptional regulator [Saprospiraceae bacterium]